MSKEQTQPNKKFRFFRKIYRGWRVFRDWFANALDVDVERKIELYTQLATSATLKDLVYWLQIFASAGIATLGLVLNSTAVIIGAMLISPLMAPILSMGLALSTGDLTLGVRAIGNLILSTLLGIVVAVFLVALLPYKDITSEILARTEPNTLDLFIALFSGAIGAVATCREVKGVVTSIPGVAIAVALMPPLCVVGYGIGYAVSVDASKGWEMASGGGLLYLTNLVAITFTSMLVFVILRIDRPKVREAVRTWRETDPESQWWLGQINKVPSLKKAREVRSFSLRLLMILLPLLVIFIPLSNSFSKLRANFVQKQSENRVIVATRAIWKDYEVDSEGNVRSYLDDLRISEKDKKLQVYLRVFDNVPYTKGEKERFINLLAEQLEREPETIELQLVEIPTSERNENKPAIETTPTPVTVAQLRANFLQEIKNRLGEFQLPPPATLIKYDITTSSDNDSFLHIFYLSQRNIGEDGKNALQDDLKRRLGISNLSLIWTRVSSEVAKISFTGNEVNLVDEETEVLEEIGNELRQYPALKLRLMLKPSKDNEKLVEERQKSLSQFFSENYSIKEDRLVFGETEDDDLAETVQLFIGN